MKPSPFDYVRAESVQEAVNVLSEHGGDARVLAGGQSLVAMLNMRLATPKVIVDVSRLEEGRHIKQRDGRVAIGCAVRQTQLEHWSQLSTSLPLLAKALPWIGHIQTRSRGTVCGSIAHADPSSELPLCLVLLEGKVVLHSRRGTRIVEADQFYLGPLQTAREDDELIVEIRLPMLDTKAGVAFNEVAIRHGDFAIVAVAAIAEDNQIRCAIGGASDRPIATTLPMLDGEDLADALNDLAWSIEFADDLHATASYRRNLVRVIGQRTIAEAIQCRS